MRTEGFEPSQGCPQGILSPLRLPFRHVRAADSNTTSTERTRITLPRGAFLAPAARASKAITNQLALFSCLFLAAAGELGRTLPHGSAGGFLSGIFWSAAS